MLSPLAFGENVDYDIVIDNNGDTVGDVTYTTRFFDDNAGGQTFVTTRQEFGGSERVAGGDLGTTLGTANGGSVQVGTFDDPFFFDFNGFNDGFAFTGDDFFAGLDVNAIVLEINSAELGADNVGIYGRTLRDGEQVDRMGRPAINTVLLPSDLKTAFNLAEPGDDFALFGETVSNRIAELNGGDTETADALTAILLPDLLTYDATSAEGFLNGRKLTDDVIDAELALLTNGALTTDGVDGNDVAFLNAFPFLAPANGEANPIPTPSAALAGLALMGLVAGRRKRSA